MQYIQRLADDLRNIFQGSDDVSLVENKFPTLLVSEAKEQLDPVIVTGRVILSPTILREKKGPLISPLQNHECAYYHIICEENDGEEEGLWYPKWEETCSEEFCLIDDSGYCMYIFPLLSGDDSIRVHGKSEVISTAYHLYPSVIPNSIEELDKKYHYSRSNKPKETRYTEITIPINEHISVLGVVLDVDTVVPPYFVRRKVSVQLPVRPVEDRLSSKYFLDNRWSSDEQSAWDRVQSRLSIPRNVQYQPSTANAAATSSSSSSGRIGHVPMKPFYLVNNDPTRSIKDMPTVLPVALQPNSLDHFTVPNVAEIRQAMERLTLEKRAMRTLDAHAIEDVAAAVGPATSNYRYSPSQNASSTDVTAISHATTSYTTTTTNVSPSAEIMNAQEARFAEIQRKSDELGQHRRNMRDIYDDQRDADMMADTLSSPSGSYSSGSGLLGYPSPPSMYSQSSPAATAMAYSSPPMPSRSPSQSPSVGRPRSPATTTTTASTYRGKSLYADSSTLRPTGKESKS